MRPHLARQPLHRRLLGAVAALAATALLVFGLALGPLPEPLIRARPVVAITVFLQPRRVEPAPEQPVQAPAPTEPSRRARPAEPPAARPITRPQRLQPPVMPAEPTPAQVVTVPDPVTAREPSASTPRTAQREPLKLDGQVLRSAASASRGGVMAMADAAGRGTEDQHNVRPSWTRAVGSAARADCLQADENASLLSAVSIVARAMTDRCP